MRYFLLCCTISLSMATGDIIMPSYGASIAREPRIPLSELPTNPALVVANHIRAFFNQELYIPSAHASSFSKHWNGWLKSLLVAFVIAGLLSLVTNVFSGLFRLIGLFTTSGTNEVVNNIMIFGMQNFSCSNNDTHVICYMAL